MQKIIISNFETIQELELVIDGNLSVIIGAQASGKSTIAKCIYYCRKIRDYTTEYLSNPKKFSEHRPNDIFTDFLLHLRRKFMGCFGTTKHMAPFSIVFYYDFTVSSLPNKYVRISLQDQYARIYFSPTLYRAISKLLKEVSQLYSGTSVEDGVSPQGDYLKIVEYLTKIEHYSEVLKDLFCDDEEILYIPAGRILLATLSDQLIGLDVSIMDLPMQEFITTIQRIKKRFGTRIPEIIKDYSKTENGKIKKADVELAYSIIRQILRGDYVSEYDSDNIYYNERDHVKLMYASSGQQEVLWILLIIFMKILEQRKVFLVLEEPEAHLFPPAQKQVIDLIALLINSTNSNVFITTHSPYILTSINLSVYSAKVENEIENKKKTDSEPVVPKMLRIAPNHMNAYFVDNADSFTFTSIKDDDEQLIDAARIDMISSEINEMTDKIMDLEINNGFGDK